MSDRMETCCFCGDYTGNAGKGEDSNYFEHIGPLCWECYRTIRDAVESEEIERLRAELAQSKHWFTTANALAIRSTRERDDARRDRDECRRLLREACRYMEMGSLDSLRHAWYQSARAAAGGGDE